MEQEHLRIDAIQAPFNPLGGLFDIDFGSGDYRSYRAWSDERACPASDGIVEYPPS